MKRRTLDSKMKITKKETEKIRVSFLLKFTMGKKKVRAK